MHDKSYLLYSDESYFDLVTACAKSIRQFSDLPILIYMLNSDKVVDLPNTFTIKWIVPELSPAKERKNYIDRFDDNIYKLLIERPSIAKNALLFHSKTIAYIDSDSIATRYIDRIFGFYPKKTKYPYFVEGVYDYLHINGRGGADSRDDLSTTLEHPACELFGVNQYVRQRYRQTGYFVAGQSTIGFLEEWYAMCKHPKVISNFKHYAPYHEETIANVLLWKNLQLDGLPAIYINGYKKVLEFTGEARIIENWLRVPANQEDLLFFHGIKNIEEIYQIMHKLKKMKILFIAPHLSTGGMPQFLLKRIEVLKQFTDVEIHVVEYAFYGDAYVVQRNSIKELIGNNFSAHFSTKIEIADYIKIINPDIIHIDEMSERLDHNLIKLIYNPKRTYRIVETCHDVAFKPDEEKIFHPDLYSFCTPYHEDTFVNMESKFVTIEYPIENKKPTLIEKANARLKLKFEGINVINVGLWTSGKNQGEGVEIARKYPEMTFHFIGNQASNFSEYWEPLMKILPKNVKVWGERDDIATFLQAADIFMFNSTWECNPLALREAISYGLPIIARNLPQYKDMFTKYLNPIDTDLRSLNLNPKYEIVGNLKEFALKHYNAYEKVLQNNPQTSAKIIQHYVGNPFLEIRGKIDSEFKVQFFDEKNVCQYENTIKANHWIKLNRQWFTKWKTLVYENNQLIYKNEFNLNNKRVYISIDSRSLGDTIAWVHYCKIFKEKHNCEVVVSTFWNHILDYPDLELVEPGERVDCYAMYQIGWFYDENKEPELCNTIPLQKAATNILGLEFQEIRPQIKYEKKNYITEKYITIATNSTAGCKFWTREGWQDLINHFTKEDYKIINVSKERNPFDNCYQIEDTSIEATINWIDKSEFFIGLSSGLSWLAWALNKKVIMISNFTKADHEFTDCIRITNTNVCHGCWNDASIKFDKGDYLWCPLNKNTERHFECQKSITAQMVINLLNKNKIF